MKLDGQDPFEISFLSYKKKHPYFSQSTDITNRLFSSKDLEKSFFIDNKPAGCSSC